MVSSGWKIVVVLMMICVQIVCVGAPASASVNGKAGRSEVVTMAQEQNGRMLAVSEADHHVRCGLPYGTAQVVDLQVPDHLRFDTATVLMLKTMNYPIARPPKMLS